METISNVKRHIYIKREHVASYNKQKNELKTEKHLSMLIIAKATITLRKIKLRVYILVSKTIVFLLSVHITVKSKKAIWRRSLSQ